MGLHGIQEKDGSSPQTRVSEERVHLPISRLYHLITGAARVEESCLKR